MDRRVIAYSALSIYGRALKSMFSAVRHYDIMQFHVIVLCAFIFISIISVFTFDSIYAIARVA